MLDVSIAPAGKVPVVAAGRLVVNAGAVNDTKSLVCTV